MSLIVYPMNDNIGDRAAFKILQLFLCKIKLVNYKQNVCQTKYRCKAVNVAAIRQYLQERGVSVNGYVKPGAA